MANAQSHLDFPGMALWFKFRNFLHPRDKLLSEIPVRPGDAVMDYGCGPGASILPLAERVGPEGIVYAVDIHPLSIKYVQEIVEKHRLGNVRTILTDAITGLPMATVDAACLFDVFHALEQPARAIREIHRVLKPEGILFFSDHAMRHEEIIAGVTRGGLFWLAGRGERTYSFSKG